MEMTGRLTMSQKVARFRLRLQDQEWRQHGALLVAGKLIGVAVLMAAILAFNQGVLGRIAFGADAEVKAADVVNPLNTVWTLVAAFLVFGMQVGFTMLEAGFCRSRETVNVLMECIVDTCLCGLLFYAFGFAFMFSHGN
jgi:Amt family ammonium transporter